MKQDSNNFLIYELHFCLFNYPIIIYWSTKLHSIVMIPYPYFSNYMISNPPPCPFYESVC